MATEKPGLHPNQVTSPASKDTSKDDLRNAGNNNGVSDAPAQPLPMKTDGKPPRISLNSNGASSESIQNVGSGGVRFADSELAQKKSSVNSGKCIQFEEVNDTPDPEIEEAEGKTPRAREARKPRHTSVFAFGNVDAIKDKVKKKLIQKELYHVHNMYYKTGFFQKLAKDNRFENITLAVIVMNAIWIWVDTDYNKAETLITAKFVFIIADSLFFAYFSVELFVRFMAFKHKRYCLQDPWFVFDATLVTLYAFDPFTIALMAATSGGGGLDFPTPVLRLFRLARLSRLVRMLRSLPELMIMIKGMVTAATSVGYTLGLLMVITYVFAIALVNMAPTDSNIQEKYFVSVPESMHNLIIFGTFLDALSDFMFDIKDESIPCFLLTWIYIGLASLTVLNMLIGVLCEVIQAVAEEERQTMEADKVQEKFSEVLKNLDQDEDGMLSWEEFGHLLDFPQALDALESVDVDANSMIDMAQDIFFEDGEEVQVLFQDFLQMVLDMKGSNQAKVSDILKVGKRINGKFLCMKEQMDKLESTTVDLDKKLNKVIKYESHVDAKLDRINQVEAKLDLLLDRLLPVRGVSAPASDAELPLQLT